jgi:hypothetical protein
VADSGQLDVLLGARVVVFGSSKPWYESIAIALGAIYVATVEYLPLHFDYDKEGVRIETFHVDDPSLRDMQGTFDVAVSISSFEHDGLGRFIFPHPFCPTLTIFQALSADMETRSALMRIWLQCQQCDRFSSQMASLLLLFRYVSSPSR